jgi:uncharacterized protein (TIRG00374 family)
MVSEPTPTSTPTPWHKRKRKRGVWSWSRRGVTVLLLLVVIEYLVLPQLSGTRKSLHLLSTAQPFWLGLGAVLEVVSIVTYAGLTRSVLPVPRPRFSWLLRTDVTALGVSHVVPGGAATASTLRFRLLNQGGASREDALIGATVQGVGSALVLNVLLWLALVASIPLVGVNPLYGIAALLGVLLMTAVGVAVYGFIRDEDRIVRRVLMVTHRLPKRIQTGFEIGVRRTAGQLRELLANRHELRRAALWATANWVLDAASLWCFLTGFGHRVGIDGLAVGYGLANVLAVLPISPGGLGVVEGVLVPSLVGFGTPRGIATLGVISWRLFNFWLPIPVSGLTYLSLRTESWREARGWREWWKTAVAPFGMRFEQPAVTPPSPGPTEAIPRGGTPN